MPNLPSIVHEGMAGVCAGAHAGEEHMTLAEEALHNLGAVVRVSEPYMDAVTAVSGSGPAYFALLAEAMIEAGILLGLSREVSTQLVVQTMLGTAKLLRDLKMHPVELREAVTSPGGTTIAAIRELEQAGVRAAFLNAIQAAMDRSRELAHGDRNLNGVEIRVVEDPAREAAGFLIEHAAAAATSPSPEAPRLVPPTSWQRRTIPTGRVRTSGSETTGSFPPATAAPTTGSCGPPSSTRSRALPRCTASAASVPPRKRPRSTTRSSTASRSTWR